MMSNHIFLSLSSNPIIPQIFPFVYYILLIYFFAKLENHPFIIDNFPNPYEAKIIVLMAVFRYVYLNALGKQIA